MNGGAMAVMGTPLDKASDPDRAHLDISLGGSLAMDTGANWSTRTDRILTLMAAAEANGMGVREAIAATRPELRTRRRI